MAETHSESTLIGRALQECQTKASAFDQVSCIADGFAKIALDWALLLAAVGTLSMVLIELIKSLFMARRLYHNLAVWAWFRRCPEHRFALFCWLKQHPTHEDARRECLELSAGEFRDARGWYDQPSDQLFSQMQASTNVALRSWPRYPNFVNFLVGRSSWGRVNETSLKHGEGKQAPEEISSAHLKRNSDGGKVLEDLGSGDSPEYFLAQRRIDTLRIYTEWRWARLNQLAAIGISALLLIAFQSPKTEGLCDSIMLGILAGLVAPFAKDVATRLSSLSPRR
ncbi:hypothetical protein [Candidatus Nitrospira nitrificans]|uniref:Uncharacterized protein n=1 Tax=Candidatus Nitrospira nitrificans TaxID=1742973 RepID=A0A0S4L568_9BACT|nr:hypothetical protein [Candidatus Nitrospira nitrificans]CUS32849.1 hypothetical protein COMA2_110123 [Candidatus Nitrospira nitrificans]